MFVYSVSNAWHRIELSFDLDDHELGCITDGLHGHRGEIVWQHGTYD